MQTLGWRVWRRATAGVRVRNARLNSSVAFEDPARVRNIALLAHIDSGKTTLTESILHATSYLSAAGSVDTGSTTTDFLPAERERGITIQSASIPVRWKDWTFNLIDTPGHVDFGMEVESASRVIDGAVVLMDSVEGVEGQTLGVWRQLDRYSVPTRMIFLNKLDRPGASLRSSIKSILSNSLHHNPVLLTLPVASFDDSRYQSGETGVSAIVNLVDWNVWKWDSDGKATSEPLPTSEDGFSSSGMFTPSHPLVPELFKAREALVDTLSLLSPDFMDHFLSLPSTPSPYISVSPATIKSALRELTLSKEILPILCGAALRHIGTDIVLDFAGDLLASPVDVRPSSIAPSKSEDAQVLAWKVSWDKQRGWMTFVRVYSGTVTRQTTLFNTTSRQRERIGKLLLLYANRPENVDSLPFGSVGVIMGLKHTRTGDTLIGTSWTDRSAPQATSLRNITPPPAVISASVVPQSQSDVGPVKEALLALSRTDPSLRVTEDEEEGQTLVHGLGALHLEIVEGRLRDDWGVRCQFGKRRVSYRETLGGHTTISVKERWDKEVAGARAGAEVQLEVRPLTEEELALSESTATHVEADSAGAALRDAWDGNIVLDEQSHRLPHPSELHADSPLMPLVSGLASALSTSPHTSLPLSHVCVVVQNVKIDDGAPPTCVTAAASAAMRRAISEAGPGSVMEPYVRVKVDVSAEHIGRVVKDLTEHGGEIVDLGAGPGCESGAESDVLGFPEDGVYIPPAWVNPSGAAMSTAQSSSADAAGLHTKNSVRAVAPLSRMLDYSTRLRAASGGLGVFEMSVEGFRVVPDVRKREIMAEMGR